MILDLYKHYASFVSQDVRSKGILKGINSNYSNYSEFVSELENLEENNIIKEIETFIFSVNESSVSTRVKNSKGIILYIEYGKIDLSKNDVNTKTDLTLGVTVAVDFSKANNDIVEEALMAQQTYDILLKIIAVSEKIIDNPDHCPGNKYITFPVEIFPVLPGEFFGKGGWTALFKRVKQ